ncbi:MAG: hypothetical protein WBE76_20655 [Terracidiphilus sp.]
MDSLPTLDDVYRKFGFASEAAQLLETELGTLLFGEQAIAEGLLGGDGKRATEIMNAINRQTLGTLIKNAKGSSQSIEQIATLLELALRERNRLAHSFYRQHNFRRNSGEGRALMMKDLETIHEVILEAYKQLMLLGGIDLGALAEEPFTLPRAHVWII